MPNRSPEFRRPPEILPSVEKRAVLALTQKEKEILDRLPVKLEEETILELKRIAQVIAGDLGMKVKLGEPGKGSFFDSEKGEITLDPLHIAEAPERARMIAAHEGAHRRLTRGPKTLGVQPELIEELYGKAIGFAYTSNVIEDPAVNNWTKKEFEGLRGDFDKTYSKMFEKEHIPLGLDHPEVQAIIRRIGTIPNLVWVGSELIRAWQTGKFSKGIKKVRPLVAEVLGKTFLPSKRASNALPEYGYNETQVLEAARERFRIVYEEIWSPVQKLIEEDLKNEAERKMVENELKQKLQQKGTEGMAKDLEQGKTGTPLDNLPDDLRKELAEAMKKAAKKQGESLEQEAKNFSQETEEIKKEGEKIKKTKKELAEKKKTAAGKEAEELKKEEDKLKTREEINSAKKQDLEEKKEEHKKAIEREITQKENIPLEMNELSEKLKKELGQAFDRLPKKEQERLRGEAEQTLQDLEDALNETVESKMNPDQPESHAEFRERKENEKAEARREEERGREYKEMKKAAKEIAEAGRTEYDKIRAEMDDVIEDLYNRLEEFFTRERHPKWRQGFRAGPRLTLSRAMQFASGAKPEAYREMWEQKTVPTRFEYKFSLVVDLSQSMSEGNKIVETRKGLIVLSEVLNRLGIDFEVIGFNGDIGAVLLKDFDKKFDEETEEGLARLIKTPAGNTPTAGALKLAYGRLKEHVGKDNFIVVLTDGVPYPEGTKPTQNLVRKILRDEEAPIKVVGVGLGENTGFVRDLFPSAVGDICVKDLPETLGNLLEEMITNPELFKMNEEAKERFIGKE
ncbi:VWA domain-containing protein [Candidatus Falkowbacteria bacterium]|nr:VWA domain-containing protein [Candidatus Falkowbacteria bacterium]